MTADKLSLRLALWRTAVMAEPGAGPGEGTQAADQALVLDAEAIMVAEHAAWLSEFLRGRPAPAPGGQVPGKG